MVKKSKVPVTVETVIAQIKLNLETTTENSNSNKILARLVRLSNTSNKIAVSAATESEREEKAKARMDAAETRKAAKIEKAEAQLKALQEKLVALKA